MTIDYSKEQKASSGPPLARASGQFLHWHGVLLPSGLGLKIDQVDVGRAGFVRCLPNGCVAEVVMDDNLISKMRTGQSATFIIFQTPEEGIGFPISLKGLGEGFDKLP
jgi:invasion protein IalB